MKHENLTYAQGMRRVVASLTAPGSRFEVPNAPTVALVVTEESPNHTVVSVAWPEQPNTWVRRRWITPHRAGNPRYPAFTHYWTFDLDYALRNHRWDAAAAGAELVEDTYLVPGWVPDLREAEYSPELEHEGDAFVAVIRVSDFWWTGKHVGRLRAAVKKTTCRGRDRISARPSLIDWTTVDAPLRVKSSGAVRKNEVWTLPV